MTEPRRIEMEIEVPATVEEAWAAIATGPGITAWFMPAEVEGKVGGAVVHHPDQDAAGAGTITAYDPPHRFAYEETPEGVVPDLDGGAGPMATEFLVEARDGGSCVVRMVMSGFGDSDAWDRAIESFTAGWRHALASLRLYLTHFPGRPAASVNAGLVPVGRGEGWSRLTRALGIPQRPGPGDRVASGRPGAPVLAGTVERVQDGMLTLLLTEPAPGIAAFGTGGPTDETFLFLRAQLFGPDAGTVAAREQARWRRWLTDLAAPPRPI